MNRDAAPTLRIIYYPKTKLSVCAVHCIAASIGVAFGIRFGLGTSWLMFVGWYLLAFVGLHVVMVPVMTGWHVVSIRFERWVRSIIEEELIRSDMKNYEEQFRRVFPARNDPSKPSS